MEFQALSWHAQDLNENADHDGGGGGDMEFKDLVEQQYVIKAFGRARDGRSVSVTLTGFKPFFYVKVPDSWTKEDVRKMKDYLIEIKEWHGGHEMALVMRKNLYGYTNFKEFKFVRMSFDSQWALRRAARFFSKKRKIPGVAPFVENMYQCFESNIDPYIRFFHLSGVRPCGWIRLPAPSSSTASTVLKTISQIDMQVPYDKVSPADVVVEAPQGEEPALPSSSRLDAPFRVASFDLECFSDSGDFPVAKRDYQKLAQTLFEAHAVWTGPSPLREQRLGDYDVRARVAFLIAKTFSVERLLLNNFDALDREIGLVSKATPKKRYAPEALLNDKILPCIDIAMTALRKSVISAHGCCAAGDDDDPAPAAAAGEDEDLLTKTSKDRADVIRDLTEKLNKALPPLQGDPIIQIGNTVHVYGERRVSQRHVFTLNSCSACGGGENGEEIHVKTFESEAELIKAWALLVREQDPDVLTGYNIFGFDFEYVAHRAQELSCYAAIMRSLSRFQTIPCELKEKNLSSSALGDNILKFIEMPGRVQIDMMKVVQRDHKLDSYKLDAVAEHFTGERKHDVSPHEIFRLHRGSADDRKRIAEYCVQDCELVNNLIIKLEVMANNMGMANVCHVPLSFIFLRGQGIKIFSLVLNQCNKDGFVVPVVSAAANKAPFARFGSAPVAAAPPPPEESMSFEGAIVLEPEQGIYLNDPVSVLDYASLYPSSMISENLSHDCLVMDKAYASVPGVSYVEVAYDVYNAKKEKVSERTCRYAQNRRGLIPRTLELLLQARKATRAKMTWVAVRVKSRPGETLVGTLRPAYSAKAAATPDARFRMTLVSGGSAKAPDVVLDGADIESVEDVHNAFQKAVLDGLQNAYKVTANSLYGQMGAQTSQLYLKDIAACTTATGRNMIMKAKAFLEAEFSARVIYGDTDSIFCIFPNPDGKTGSDLLRHSIAVADQASLKFKKHIKPPHDLEYDKTFYPFILLSKKRYVGNLYEKDPEKYKMKSMGIVLKRRDNAPIVKHVYSGIIDILLNRKDLAASVLFLKEELQKIVDGEKKLEDFIISKSLRLTYKDPMRIAHKVLADRMGERDPGNRPQIGDRIPYVYFVAPQQQHADARGAKHKVLQGERIEHPQYVRDRGLQPDYHFYITNQIMKPVLQIYGLVVEQLDGFGKHKDYFKLAHEKFANALSDPKKVSDKLATLRETSAMEVLFVPLLSRLACKSNGNRPITDFFGPLALF